MSFKKSNEYLEITGSICSGKSYYAVKYPNVVKVNKFFFIIGIWYTLFSNYKAFSFLFKKCCQSDRSYLFSINVGLNVFAKIGYFQFCRIFRKKTILDEGLTHIPFILQLDIYETRRFLHLFEDTLKQINVEFCFCDIEVIESRLRCRGHRRVRNQSDFVSFLKAHTAIQTFYPGLLRKTVNKIKVLNCTQ